MPNLTYNNRDDDSAITLATPLPETPRCGAVRVRLATRDDFDFIDGLQKMHSHMVGFLQRPALHSYLDNENVILAEDENGTPLGYCIFKDEYMDHDDVGIVYHLNVQPLRHRNLVGATLIKSAIERCARACKLLSCWCAQDIRANYFWEALGFVPIAFRTGSEKKQRTHIFWQRRIRHGDDRTPLWFPRQTKGGGVRESRVCLPIPPGTHWLEAKPVVLPSLPQRKSQAELNGEDPLAQKLLPGGQPVRPRAAAKAEVSPEERAARIRASSAHLGGAPSGKKAVLSGGRVKYVERSDVDDAIEEIAEKSLQPTAKKPKRPKKKYDKEFVKAARDVRDVYLEAMNDPENGFVLPPDSHGKWDVSRQLPASPFVSRDGDDEDGDIIDAEYVIHEPRALPEADAA